MRITEKQLRRVIREELELRGLPKRPGALGPGGKAAVSAVIRRLRREHPGVTFDRDDAAGIVTVGAAGAPVTVNVVGRAYNELEMVLRNAVSRAGKPA